MGKTANRLRELHPSRYNKHEIRLADVGGLLQKHLGFLHPRLESRDRPQDDVAGLITDISIAASEEARRRAGNESRKKSFAALLAMLRMPDDELIAVLSTCDMATSGRIKTAHAELCYEVNGIPVVDVPPASDLSEDDRIAAAQGGNAFLHAVDALNADESDSPLIFNLAIELPRMGPPPMEGPRRKPHPSMKDGLRATRMELPLHLPMGIDGLRQAMENAITVAEQEAGRAGNKNKPHMDELARACVAFMLKYQPVPNTPGLRGATSPSPAVRFTTDIFELAGMPLGESRIEELLTEAKKPRKLA